MKADLTRNTFDPLKHFTRVLMQQGRVQLDADWNEQAAILLRYLQALGADLIGPHGGPPGNNLGFAITQLVVGGSPTANDFRIGLGHYYVDGILCEADSTPVVVFPPAGATSNNVVEVDQWTLDGIPFQVNQYVEGFDDASNPAFAPTVMQITSADQVDLQLTLQGVPTGGGNPVNPKLRRVITYLTQLDYPSPPALTAGTFQVYLDVWERLITYVEDDSIREVALGGPDTAARSKLVCQVKVTPGVTSAVPSGVDRASCSPADQLTAQFQAENRGRLKARAKQTSAATDPCIISPEARYRGPENQLYRVELHRPGSAWDANEGTKNSAATFKWSREDGSAVYAIVSMASGGGTTTVTLENLGRDDRFTLGEGEWVEIQDDDYVLQNRAATLLQVQSIDRTMSSVTLNGTPDANVLQNFNSSGLAHHPLVRRWDHQAGDPAEGGLTLGSDNAALVQEDPWLELEDGVQIQFQKPALGRPDNQYRTGDYWLIPARTAIGDVVWPTETDKDSQGSSVIVPLAKPPDGIQHHYAPLAVIIVDSSGNAVVTSKCQNCLQQANPCPGT
jgi:hypothetical protein